MVKYDPYQVSEEDLSTYSGRFKHFQKIISPMNMFHSTATLQKYQQIIEEVKLNPEGQRSYTDEHLWKLRSIVDANLHPQTKEVIHFPFRSSTFVPMNIPIVFILSLLPPTVSYFFYSKLINQVVGQTVNQTYNFLFNYSNRNTSNSFTGEQLAFSYFGAVSSALVGSLGTAQLVKKLKAPKIFMSLTPVIGVVTANAFNLYFSRSQDFVNGIEVFDSKTQEKLPGKSKMAAYSAFEKTLIVRTLIPLPVFTLPQLCLYGLKKLNLYPIIPIGRVTINTIISAAILYIGLSGAIALFPQIVNVPSSELEPEYQNLKNSRGELITLIQFNKGI